MCDSEVILKRVLTSVKCLKECLSNVHMKLLITYNKSVYGYCHYFMYGDEHLSFYSSYVGHPLNIPTSCICIFQNLLLLLIIITYLTFSFHTAPFLIFCCQLDIFLWIFSISFKLKTLVLRYAA